MCNCVMVNFQAHRLGERIHDIDLDALRGKTVSEVIRIVTGFITYLTDQD